MEITGYSASRSEVKAEIPIKSENEGKKRGRDASFSVVCGR